jgi:hypothetical protein
MTHRTVVLPLGFGLSAVLCFAARGRATDVPRPAVRVYTNADLERVRPLRAETGVDSVPAAAPGTASSQPERGLPRGRGEAYWRREASRTRQKLSALGEQRESLRARIAEQEGDARRFLRRRSAGLDSSSSLATLQARLAAVERRIREIEDDLFERARRDGALPGWLR